MLIYFETTTKLQKTEVCKQTGKGEVCTSGIGTINLLI